MQHRDYLDLDLVVESKASAGYGVRAACAAASLSASADFSMPFTDEELAAFVAAVTPGGATRRLAPTVPAPATQTVDVRTMGERLFGAAFAGDLGPCLVESIRTARSDQNKGLRVRLHLADVPELGRIPWEFLFSDFLDRYLALSSDTPVVRYLDVPSAVDPLPVTLPLRVVVVVSDPVDAPGLDVKRETELLKATTADLQKSGLLSLEFLEAATLSNLQHRLYEPMHVFHFIGHGAYDDTLRQGTLLFEDEQKNAVRVSATRLATLLHDAPDLRLAVLNSCEGARGSATDPFSGVAQTLLRQGLPSAVAMQSEISDRAAIAFAHEFYFALCRGADVDAATSEGRKAVFSAGNDVEWGTPVLFLRSDDARLFEVAEEPAEPSRDQHWDALYSAAQTALAADETERAKSLLEQLASESPDYKDVTALLPRVSSQAAAQQQYARPQVVQPQVVQPQVVQPQIVPEQRQGEQVAPPGWFRADPPPPPPPSGWQPQSETQPQAQTQTQTRQNPPPRWTPPPQQRARRRRFRWGRALFALVLLAVLAFGVAVGYQAYLSYTHTVHVARVGSLVVNGSSEDWPASAKRHSSDHVVDPVAVSGQSPAPRATAQWRLAWNDSFLYLYVEVVDPDPRLRPAGSPAELWQSDSVSLELGSDPSSLTKNDPLRLTDVDILVGMVSPERLGVVVNPARKQSGSGKVVFGVGKVVPDAQVAERTGSGGYVLEAAIPWRAIRPLPPSSGTTLGANLDVSDADAAGRYAQMVSNNPLRTKTNQNVPKTWYLLKLDS